MTETQPTKAIPPVRRGDSENTGAWVGFLAAAFAVVGMMGLFVSYAAPLPYLREFNREAVLDRVAAAPVGEREAMRDALGDSAGRVLDGGGLLEDRIGAERRDLRARLGAEAEATAERLRLLMVVVTIVGAGFGGVLLAMQRRG